MTASARETTVFSLIPTKLQLDRPHAGLDRTLTLISAPAVL